MTAIIWDIPDTSSLKRHLLSNGLTAASAEYLTWDWADRLNNTSVFRQYLCIAKKKNLPKNTFLFALPLELIDDYINETITA